MPKRPAPEPQPPAGPGSHTRPSESPTRQMRVGRDAHEPPTNRIPGPPPITTQDLPVEPPTGQTTTMDFSAPAAQPKRNLFGFLRDPLSIFLVFVTTLALVVAGLIGAELYARHIADDKITKATECEVEDNAKASFGVSPPFLWQHITGHYTNISIKTAGNQIKDAKEMTAELSISDVRLHDTGDSGGTIGALDATLIWSASGIEQTIQNMVPLLGKMVDSVTTHPDDGTVELKSTLGGVVVKPQVQNNQLSLQLVKLSGLASFAGALATENIQPELDKFTDKLTSKYPLGIHPDSLQVTDTGVIAKFSTRNASIPTHGQNPCFANL
ncbi:hypothetical protein C1Y40_05453 [Mycobacterium talmoniae]|uniref:Uncharacterized protein n=2 Tax=Mycobacterium talmoniae TaxID=1858794 RepID=A0A2S8BCK0_9MYCO|nr:hypothetical protein C1Y40_05453 [Mycobacterium talmoniae]